VADVEIVGGEDRGLGQFLQRDPGAEPLMESFQAKMNTFV